MLTQKCLIAAALVGTLSPSAFAQSTGTGNATVYALDSSGSQITWFLAGKPGNLLGSTGLTGLQAGERLLGIDYRPATGDLLGLGSSNRLYTLQPASGAATPIGAGPFTPALSGTSFGVDFNPVPDRFRVVSDAEQNLRLNPNTGGVAGVDTPLAYAAGDVNFGADPLVLSVAYTNNFAGATGTTLYAIDSALDVLVTQGSVGSSPISPNSGQLFTVGSLGVNSSNLVGFDVTPSGGALAALAGNGGSRLYTINLNTGAATLIGSIGATPQRVADIAVAPAGSPRIYGLSASDSLVSFLQGNPNTLLTSAPIRGLQMGETLLGIDFRPATGELLALGSSNQLYRVDPTTAAATLIGAGPFTPALSGAAFGVDFNPVPDRLRVVSDADQNLRLNPNTGAVAGVDTALAYAPGDVNAAVNPNLVASAYTQNFAGTSSTTLYGIDSNLNSLVTQGSLGGSPVSPNSGQLFTVGALGFTTGDQIGFDVSSLGGVFASLTPIGASSSSLYTVNLNTGAATLVGSIGGGETLKDIAVSPLSQPLLYGATANNNLVSFLPGSATSLVSSQPINGLQAGETIVGLDFRPSTGELLAVGSQNRVYRIHPVNGSARPISGLSFTPPLNGTNFGVDFNPVPDRIRLVSDAEQNLRLNPDSGQVAGTDTSLSYAATDPNFGANPTVVGSAYSSSFVGSTSTTLYAIDAGLDLLVTQGSPGGSPTSPNSGQLFTLGALNFDTDSRVGFSISTLGGAFASLSAPGATSSQLYSVNLTTGGATLLGPIAGEALVALAAR